MPRYFSVTHLQLWHEASESRHSAGRGLHSDYGLPFNYYARCRSQLVTLVTAFFSLWSFAVFMSSTLCLLWHASCVALSRSGEGAQNAHGGSM